MPGTARTTGSVPRIEDHFAPGSLWQLVRKGHPYDFRETYEVMRRLYGYEAFYVNLGLWRDGIGTHEAGRELVRTVAAELGLRPGDRLVEAGSGLGQGAIDLCREHDLGEVLGINPNERQVGFANALAASAGLADRVRHVVGDACTALDGLAGRGFRHAIAIECIGHFPEPMAFLSSARRVLAPGGRIAFCLNVWRGRPRAVDRAWMRLGFGTAGLPGEAWVERVTRAGFVDVRRHDLTDRVLEPVIERLGDRLARDPQATAAVSRQLRPVLKGLVGATRRALADRAIGYELISAGVPG